MTYAGSVAGEANSRGVVRRLSTVPRSELAISFLGRPELDDLWHRLCADAALSADDEVLVVLAESRAHERAGRLTESARTAQMAIDLARRHTDRVGQAGGLSHLAYAEYRMGATAEAATHAQEALDVLGPHAHTVTAQLVLGLIAVDGCEWEAARQRFMTARSWSTDIGFPLGVMLALHNLSVLYFHTGRFDLALGAANDVDRLNREVQYPGWAYPWTRAIVSQQIGDRDAARDALSQLLDLDPAPAFAAALGRMLQAQLALDEEDVDESERCLVAARTDAERLGNPMARAMVLLVTSRVRRTRGDAASAQGWIDEAIVEVRQAGITTLEGWMTLERARVRWALGDVVGAERQTRETLAAAETRAAAHIAAEASVLLAAILSEQASADSSSAWVDAAQRVRDGGYGFLLERERALVVPRAATLARSADRDVRRAGQQLLELLSAAIPVPLHVVGLGRFELRQGRRLVPAADLKRRRAGQLLRFLLIQHHHRAPRDVIIEALWPDQAEAQGQLHQASSSLRRALEPDLPDKFPSRYLRLSGDMVELVLPPGSTVDFERFETMTRPTVREPEPSVAELSTALAIYDGELFAEDRYADWAAPRRSALVDAAATAGATLAAVRLAGGDARGALADATLAIARDPLREDAVHVAIRAALAMGDRIGAVRMYRRHELLLRQELGVAPSGALQELVATAGVAHSP